MVSLGNDRQLVSVPQIFGCFFVGFMCLVGDQQRWFHRDVKSGLISETPMIFALNDVVSPRCFHPT